MNDLLPCPFCGGEAQRDDTYAPKIFYGCPEAKCDIWVLSLDAWNRRAAVSGERVREALEPDDIALITKHRLFVEPERDFWWVYQDVESSEWYAGKSIKHAVAAFVATLPLAAQPEGKQQ